MLGGTFIFCRIQSTSFQESEIQRFSYLCFIKLPGQLQLVNCKQHVLRFERCEKVVDPMRPEESHESHGLGLGNKAPFQLKILITGCKKVIGRKRPPQAFYINCGGRRPSLLIRDGLRSPRIPRGGIWPCVFGRKAHEQLWSWERDLKLHQGLVCLEPGTITL